ncbi:hypothetical protein [Bartonella tribocorum]|uniref:Uncharacterized protein n=1 Tax=Bartonella tribocorum TaxID=85701 RepID=A0A2M6UTL5_9HYPH|nr:hypothetical protein [Bartonella tribocorum]PIT69501.1 hypothetical protein CEV08_06070 [Bartonella tribocorum]
MMKIFKNYILSVFISSTFFISQTVNVNANYLINEAPKEKFSVSLMKQVKNAKSDVISTTAFYVPSVSYQTENGTTGDGKVEKVIELITIGTFGTGMAIGYAASMAGMFLGLIINKIVSFFKVR